MSGRGLFRGEAGEESGGTAPVAGQQAPRKNGRKVAFRLLAALLSLFAIEAGVMVALDLLGVAPGWPRTLLDSFLLLLLGVPILYVTAGRPMALQLAMEEALRRTAGEQEAAISRYEHELRLREESERRAEDQSRRLELLNRIATSILEEADLREVTEKALAEVARMMDLPRCSVHLFPEGPTIEHCAPGFPPSRPSAVRCARFPQAEDYKEGRTRVINDVRQCFCHRDRQEELKRVRLGAYIGVPLLARGRLLGVLFLDSDRPREWTAGEIVAAETLAHQLALAHHHVTLANDRQDLAQRLLSLMNNVPGIVYRGLRDWSLTFIGAEVERLLGYRPAEFYEGAVSWRDLIHPEDRERVAQSFREAVRAHDRVLQTEYRIVGRDGQVRWLTDRRQIFYDATGRFSYVDGLLTDITERKKGEEERLQLEKQLYQSQKMEAIGRLAGGIAHDFNNILTAVRGYADLALARLGPSDPARCAVEEIGLSCDRAASLTRQILAFSRKQVLQPEVLDLNGIVADMGSMLRRVIGEDVELCVVPAPNLWNVRADPIQVEQVILNLAVNARDAMPQGGTLSIETANVDLSERYAAEHYPVVPGHYVMLGVSDTGCGMTDEVKARIFEPFFTTKEKGKGTGLGLATVYGIVKQSGGYIWVYSERGKGTTFKIYFPRAEEGAQATRRPPVPQPASLAGTETILVAEDDEILRMLLQTVLSEAGYTVILAESGAEALEKARAFDGRIHLLLTDVVMQGMSGQELAEKFPALVSRGRVLFMSGYTENAIVHQGVLDPGIPFLQKPFSRIVLLRKVREILDQEPDGAQE